MPGQFELLTWQWITESKDGMWTVTLKRWPKIEYATGSMKFRNLIINTESHVVWKVKKNVLTWSGKHGVIYQPAWNMTVCDFNLRWGFRPGNYGFWSFILGNVTMTGEVGTTNIEAVISKKCSKKRHRRAPDEEEDTEILPPLGNDEEGNDGKRRSFLKWLLRKTGLEQGDENDNSWRQSLEELFASWFRFIGSKM
ncbi:uncharacterized protein LOC142321742 [Lycorma delicatula]|uniref:uncharacterized protein LOC142321742 n=1 Tax=Lycorma delicatula TaxID=130591 RepID=UPI003F51A5AF